MPVARRTVDLAPRMLALAALRTAAPRAAAVREVEGALARALDVPHVVATSSGRAALGAILRALALPARARVVVPAYTDESVPAAVRAVGSTTFVDADLRDANPDARALAGALAAGGLDAGPGVRAVVTAHHFGRVADLDGFARVARAHGLPLVEDCTHAVGARWHDRPVGAIGSAGYVSFNFTKPLTGCGGGAVVTGDAALAADVRRLLAKERPEPRGVTARRAAKTALLRLVTSRALFSVGPYPALRVLGARARGVVSTYKAVADRPGSTATGGAMNEVAAELLLDRLPHLRARIARRRELDALFHDALDPAVPRLTDRPGSAGVAYFTVACVPDRAGVARALLAHGIDTGHALLRDVASAAGAAGPFPVTARLVAESLQVPTHPGTRRAEVLAAARVIGRWWHAHPCARGGSDPVDPAPPGG